VTRPTSGIGVNEGFGVFSAAGDFVDLGVAAGDCVGAAVNAVVGDSVADAAADGAGGAMSSGLSGAGASEQACRSRASVSSAAQNVKPYRLNMHILSAKESLALCFFTGIIARERPDDKPALVLGIACRSSTRGYAC
jgi:hypothetical protein